MIYSCNFYDLCVKNNQRPKSIKNIPWYRHTRISQVNIWFYFFHFKLSGKNVTPFRSCHLVFIFARFAIWRALLCVYAIIRAADSGLFETLRPAAPRLPRGGLRLAFVTEWLQPPPDYAERCVSLFFVQFIPIHAKISNAKFQNGHSALFYETLKKSETKLTRHVDIADWNDFYYILRKPTIFESIIPWKVIIDANKINA